MFFSLFPLISPFSFRFIDSNGFDVPNVSEYKRFFIVLNNSAEILRFELLNHFYNLELDRDKLTFFLEDPCIYYVKEMAIYKIDQSKYVDFKKILSEPAHLKLSNLIAKGAVKYVSKSKSQLGKYDVCTRKLEYVIDNLKHVYELIGSKYKYTTYPSSNMGNSSDLIGDQNYEEDHNDNIDIKNGLNLISNNKNIFTLRIFLINDVNRFRIHQSELLKINKSIFDRINKILKNNQINMKINITGQLNLIETGIKDKKTYNDYFLEEMYSFNTIEGLNQNKINFDNSAKPLKDFRNSFEYIRVNSSNSKTELANSHLIMLLKEKTIKDIKQSSKTHHEGMSFFKGINKLNECYSLVYLDEDDEFSAKKILHEILHSLGIPHDTKAKGFLMDEIYRISQKDDNSLILSDESKSLLKNILSNISVNVNFDINKVIESGNEANKLVEQLRRNSFKEIVKNKLNGKAPDTTNTKYYLSLSLIFYIVCIVVAIIYIK